MTFMLAFARSAARRRDFLTLAGLAAGVVPLATIVHLAAELAATAGPTAAFAWRHAYMVPLFFGSLGAFAAALGVGRGRREFVRRSAFTRAAWRRAGAPACVRDLFLVNLAFFAATQLLEDVPIAAGSIAVGLAVAAAGSLLAAFLVFALGRTLVVAIAAAIALAAARDAGAFHPVRVERATRRASSAFSLFVPNRPPPIPSSI
jgi:hypothetical protein